MSRWPQYNELSISRHLGRDKFGGMMLVVDNTYHTGHETDLLIVNHRNLHYIDVEIKISRQDLKADRAKDKWRYQPWSGWNKPREPVQELEWPRRIWKHYYCIAEPIWQPALLEFVSPMSGVFTIRIDDDGHYRGITVRKKCKANPNAKPATPEEIIKLAYLANVRMHESYRHLDEQRRVHADEMRSMEEKLEKGGMCRPIGWRAKDSAERVCYSPSILRAVGGD